MTGADEGRHSTSAPAQALIEPGLAGFSLKALGARSGTRCTPVLPQPSQVKRREPAQPALRLLTKGPLSC
jgi:hypothetical protein